MAVLILTISCLKFRLATNLKWVKGISVVLCVMCVEKPLVQRRTSLHIFSQHAMHGKKSFNCDLWLKSNYFVKDINSDIQDENLLKGINRLNTYNLS